VSAAVRLYGERNRREGDVLAFTPRERTVFIEDDGSAWRVGFFVGGLAAAALGFVVAGILVRLGFVVVVLH
jgi:hypothetical protein